MKTVISICLILIVSILAIQPILSKGFFSVHDDTQVARVYEMHKSLKDGQVPVRWVSDLGYGYGYPVFNFYAPLAYYVGGISNFLVDSLVATKLMLVVGILIAGISMFFLSREFFGDAGGVVSGILYLFAPYHALDIYVRGDVAEFYAFAFIPLAFFALWKVHKSPTWWMVILGSLSTAGIIVSHNLTAMMAMPFLLVFALLIFYRLRRTKETRVKILPLVIIVLGIGVSAFYFLPVFAEMKYTNVLSVVGGGSDFRDHFLCLSQLWSGFWGYGGSIPGCNDGLSLQLGKIHILFSLLALVTLGILLVKKNKENQNQLLILILGILGLGFSLFMLFPISEWLWNLIPPLAFFQFPWRFLLLATFFSSLISGSIATLLQIFLGKKELQIFFACILVAIITALFYSKYFHPQKIYPVTAKDYTSEYALKWVTSRISDEYMPPHFNKPSSAAEVVKDGFVFSKGSGSIYLGQQKTQDKKISTKSSEPTVLLAKIAPFPAWKAFVDGKEVKLAGTNTGYPISLPSGTHQIEFKFVQTTIEKIANTISLASILILIAGIIYRSTLINHEKKR